MSNKYPFHTGTRRVASDQNKVSVPRINFVFRYLCKRDWLVKFSEIIVSKFKWLQNLSFNVVDKITVPPVDPRQREFLPSRIQCGRLLMIEITNVSVTWRTLQLISPKGRTFKAMIDEFVQESSYLNQELLPAYQTTRGLKIYSDTLDMLRTKFPFYIRELEGIADGSVVPFHKVSCDHGFS